jgi:hypothetical protein
MVAAARRMITFETIILAAMTATVIMVIKGWHRHRG